MGVMLKFSLHWVNVVILAKFHNPSILNPDFLERNNIVPAEWKAIEVLTTPAFATVKYERNVVFILDQERLEIRKECDTFKDDYEVHEFASKYVTILPHVTYQSVGLNWQISIEKEEPERFLTERFINSEALKESKSELLQSSIKLSFKADDAVCNLDFTPGKAKIPGKDIYNAIIINANFHHQGPFSSDQIVAIITQWKDREDYFKKIIPRLLG